MKKLPVSLIILLLTNLIQAQSIKVNDTDFSKGKLGNLQEISLDDLTKFHGHLCDGLVEGFMAIQLGLDELYPNQIADRTNTRIVSKASPCWADAAIYITGGRYQFNTFYVDTAFKGMFIIQRIDNQRAVIIKRKPNVKPAIIDELGNKAIAKQLNSCELEKLKKLEKDYADKLRKRKPTDFFEVQEINDFTWHPNTKNDYIKTDIINKNQTGCNKNNK
jgi:formylmethanofuran dehydrogenase subunit E